MKVLLLLLTLSLISISSYAQRMISDFVAENMPNTGKNEGPAVSLIPCQTLDEGTSPDPMEFTVYDDNTAPEKIRIRVESSNASLIPVRNIRISGKGEHHTIAFIPEPHAAGNAMITIYARDRSGAETASSFEVRVGGISAQH